MRLKALLGAAALSVGGMLLPQAALADEAMLATCIAKYQEMGVSPDVALGQCQKTSIASCIKGLMNGKFKAQVIKESGNKFLMDLGNSDSRWLEGRQWKELGCRANEAGPYRRQLNQQGRGPLKQLLSFTPKDLFFSGGNSHEWFRQGWCSSGDIAVDQPYSIEEAKIACESGLDPIAKNQEKPEDADLIWETDVQTDI